MRFKLLKNADGGTYLKAIGGGNLADLDNETIGMLWDDGLRPYEIYTYNKEDAKYYGAFAPAGTISGWDIKHIFSTPSALKTMPFFDCIIMGSDLESCTEYWKG